MVLPDLLRTRFRLEQHLLQGRVDHGGAEDDLEEDEPESLETWSDSGQLHFGRRKRGAAERTTRPEMACQDVKCFAASDI